MNNQTTNNASNSTTSETAEADTTSSPIVQPNTPQQPTRNENGSNNNSPTSELSPNFLKAHLFHVHVLCARRNLICLSLLREYLKTTRSIQKYSNQS